MASEKAMRRLKAEAKRAASEGFTLVELMVAMAVMMIFMTAAIAGVIEAQRGMNTVVARTSNMNDALPFLDAIAEQVKDATAVAEYGGAGPYSELWLYDQDPPSSWGYNCTVWVYSSTGSDLLAYVANVTSASPVEVASPTPAGITAAGMTVRAQLDNLGAVSGTGIFQYFAGYPGLVDISAELQYPNGGAQSDVQEASTPAQLEVEVDNAATSSPSGLAPLSSTNPDQYCY